MTDPKLVHLRPTPYGVLCREDAGEVGFASQRLELHNSEEANSQVSKSADFEGRCDKSIKEDTDNALL
jgi:hypothetical protein